VLTAWFLRDDGTLIGPGADDDSYDYRQQERPSGKGAKNNRTPDVSPHPSAPLKRAPTVCNGRITAARSMARKVPADSVRSTDRNSAPSRSLRNLRTRLEDGFGHQPLVFALLRPWRDQYTATPARSAKG